MQKYLHLLTDGLPKIIEEALKLLGTLEVPGSGNNPLIMEWAKETGLSKMYSGDDVPWCGLFAAVVVKRSGREPIDKALWARNWAKWGVRVTSAKLGDVLVFQRGTAGHVGFYVAEDYECYHVLGGNQSDKVNIARIEKKRCIAIRRPEYKNMPASVKQYVVKPDGLVSTNEA